MKAFKTLRFVPPPLRLRRVFMRTRSDGIFHCRKLRPSGIHVEWTGCQAMPFLITSEAKKMTQATSAQQISNRLSTGK
jgi:hypothetical protein